MFPVAYRSGKFGSEGRTTKFDLDFPGGTPRDLIAAIQKAWGKPLNAIVPEEFADTTLPALKMRKVTIPQLFEALQAASLNPAIAFGRAADLGSVETGRLADLVLLDANPLYDIKNIQKVDAVIAAGRLYDRASINRLMRLSEQLAEKN